MQTPSPLPTTIYLHSSTAQREPFALLTDAMDIRTLFFNRLNIVSSYRRMYDIYPVLQHKIYVVFILI